MKEKPVEELIKYLESGECTIWDIETLFENKPDIETLEAIFTKEQLAIIRAILKHSMYAFDKYRNEESEDSHPNIRIKIADLEAKFKIHKHETTKKYSGTAV